LLSEVVSCYISCIAKIGFSGASNYVFIILKPNGLSSYSYLAFNGLTPAFLKLLPKGLLTPGLKKG